MSRVMHNVRNSAHVFHTKLVSNTLLTIFLAAVALLFLGSPHIARADAVAVNGCYSGMQIGDYVTVYCGTPDQMANQIVADMNKVGSPYDDRQFTLRDYYFNNDHLVFGVNVIACLSSGYCWGTGGGFGIKCPEGYTVYGTAGLCV